jgi:DNA-binding CsgD family transcriptional regulator
VIGLAALLKRTVLEQDSLPAELYGFFAQELYQGLSDSVQEDLAVLARLPQISPDVAVMLLGARAPAVLHQASLKGFIAEEGTGELGIHPLLRSFLRRQRPVLSPDDVDRLFQVGAALVDLRQWNQGFAIVEEIHSHDLFVRLMTAGLYDLLSHGRTATVERWLGWAHSANATSPVIELAEAEVAFRRGDLRRAELFASSAAPRLEEDHPHRSRAFFRAGQIAYHLDHLTDARRSLVAAERAAFGEADLRLAIWGHFLLAAEGLEGDAAALLDRLASLSDGAPDMIARLHTGQLLLASRTGGLEPALASARSALELLDDVGDPLVRSGLRHLYAWCLALSGRYDDATPIVSEGLEHVSRDRLHFVEPHFNVVGAVVSIGQRRFREADALLTTVASSGERLDDVYLSLSAAIYRLQLRISEGALERGVAEARGSQPRPDVGPGFHEYSSAMALAHAGLNQFDAASAWIEKSATGRLPIESRVLNAWTKAILALSLEDDAAQDVVGRAFKLTKASGNFHGLVLAYRAFPRLLLALDAPSDSEDLADLLDEAADHSLAKSVGLSVRRRSTTRRATSLTDREREVHALLQRGLSNQEIGRTLFISEVTVKSHLRQVYRKLRVKSRTQAALIDLD